MWWHPPRFRTTGNGDNSRRTLPPTKTGPHPTSVAGCGPQYAPFSSTRRPDARSRSLEQADEAADDAHAKEGEDDDDRRDVLLQQLAHEQREGHGCEAGDQGVEVLLEGGDLHLVKAVGTERGVLRERALDALGIAGDGRPVNIGTSLLLNRGDNRLEADGDPALDQSTNDEHTKDGSALGDLAKLATREVLRDVGTGPVASLLGVPEECKTDDVPEHEEQDGAKRRAAQCQGGTKGTQQRAHRIPEDRVADAGERTHHTNLDALDGDVVDGLAVGAALLEGEGDADDGGRDVRVRVVELEVTLQSRDLPFSDKIKVGEKVVTSGLDDIYPKGIPVGVVTKVEPGDSGSYIDVTVSSPKSIGTSEYVLVLYVDTKVELPDLDEEEENAGDGQVRRKPKR